MSSSRIRGIDDYVVDSTTGEINDDTLFRSSSNDEDPSSPYEMMLSERTLVIDLQSHLCDSQISDVTLMGTDGKSVVAVRSILAMRSPFFKSLLFGTFKERQSSAVTLGFSSLVLQAVVEYCYTDEIKKTFESVSFEATARSMVGLVTAGNYFALPGLQRTAYRLTCLMMDEYPALACAVLDESIGENKSSDNKSIANNTPHYAAVELSRVALGIIRLRTESALLPNDTYGLGVQSLGPLAMEQVMEDRRIQVNEFVLFQVLKKWVGDNNGNERVTHARRLAARIDFSKISPTDLSTIVASSGFVPMELLLEAYKNQALLAEQEGIDFGQGRKPALAATTGAVMLQGAGLAAVNGKYSFATHVIHNPNNCGNIHNGHRSEAVRYFRNGNLFGPGLFCLSMRYTAVDRTRMWCLDFIDQKNEATELYYAPVLSEFDPPPMQKWEAASHDKIRRLQDRKRQQKKKSKTKQTHTFVARETNSSDEAPPICIWLPDDPGTGSLL